MAAEDEGRKQVPTRSAGMSDAQRAEQLYLFNILGMMQETYKKQKEREDASREEEVTYNEPAGPTLPVHSNLNNITFTTKKQTQSQTIQYFDETLPTSSENPSTSENEPQYVPKTIETSEIQSIEFSTPPSILYVCGANQGQSPCCEVLTHHHCPEFNIMSGGVFAKDGCGVDPQFMDLMLEKDIDTRFFEVKQVTEDMINGADIIFVADLGYRDNMRKKFPTLEFAHKTFRVLEYLSSGPEDMLDPVIMPKRFYKNFIAKTEVGVIQALQHFNLLDDVELYFQEW